MNLEELDLRWRGINKNGGGRHENRLIMAGFCATRHHDFSSHLPIFFVAIMRVPAAVTEAIQNFVPPDGFVIVRPKRSEKSVIFKWGVRVRHRNDEKHFAFICLASDYCRQNCDFLHLSNKKTSRATKHLKSSHRIFSVSFRLLI